MNTGQSLFELDEHPSACRFIAYSDWTSTWVSANRFRCSKAEVLSIISGFLDGMEYARPAYIVNVIPKKQKKESGPNEKNHRNGGRCESGQVGGGHDPEVPEADGGAR